MSEQKENEYNIVKNAVEQAKLQNAEVSGQIKSKIQNLRELGFSGETDNDVMKNANTYLNDQETILDQQEAALEPAKQKIVNEYNKIISSTAPGADPNE